MQPKCNFDKHNFLHLMVSKSWNPMKIFVDGSSLIPVTDSRDLGVTKSCNRIKV